MNVYVYVGNNPVLIADPSGLKVNVDWGNCTRRGPNFQQTIQKALDSICANIGTGAIVPGTTTSWISCMQDWCVKNPTNCFTNICNGTSKISLHCFWYKEDAECQGKCSFTKMDSKPYEINLCHPTLDSSDKLCNLECALMHELIHSCGIKHFGQNSGPGSPNLSTKEDCKCFNCIRNANKNCDGYYSPDDKTKQRYPGCTVQFSCWNRPVVR